MAINTHYVSDAQRWADIEARLQAAWPAGAGDRPLLGWTDFSPARLWSRLNDQMAVIAADRVVDFSPLPSIHVSDAQRWSSLEDTLTLLDGGGAVADPTRYQMFGARSVFDGFTGTLSAGDRGLINDYVYDLDEPALGVRGFFTGFITNVSGNPGSSTMERSQLNSEIIEGIRYSTDNRATWQTILMGGTASATVAIDGIVVTDPFDLPAGRVIFQIASIVPAITASIRRVSGGALDVDRGERAVWGAGSQAGLLGTTLPATSFKSASGQTLGRGFALLIGKMGDTRPSVLVLGTSIEQETGMYSYSADDRGNVPYIARGLDDLTGGRMHYSRMAVPTSYMRDLSAANLSKRKQLLDLAKTFNVNGQEVFDSVYLGPNINDNYGNASTWTYDLATQYTLALNERVASISNAVALSKSLWPTANVVLATSMYQVSDTVVNDRYSNQANQVRRDPLGAGSNASQFLIDLRARIFAGLGQDATVDCEAAAHDAQGRYNMDGAYVGTLVAETAAGASTLTVTGLPPKDALLVVEPGGTNSNAFLALNVVDNGNGTATVSNLYSTDRNTLAVAHLAGATVREAASSDGTHPRKLIVNKLLPPVYAVKTAGWFRKG